MTPLNGGSMLKIIFAFVLCFSSVAFATNRIQIDSLNKMVFDGTTFTYGYSIGGGCQPHSTDVKVTITQHLAGNIPYTVATVTIFDVTPEIDSCEALKHIEGSVDLGELVKIELKKERISSDRIPFVRILLPPVTYYTYL
jgi:hypothetical protein